MTQRDRTVIGVVAAALLIAVFWLLVLGPKRNEASKVSKQLTEQQQRLTAAQSDVQASEAAKSSYAANYTSVARLGKAVPADDDVPSLVYQLDAASKSVRSDFRGVKVAQGGSAQTPAVNSVQGAAANADKAKGGSGTSTTATTQTTSTAAAPASGTPAAPADPAQAATVNLPPGAVVGPAGLATMPFSFGFEGSFFDLSNFFGQVERFIATKRSTLAVAGRLLQVDGIALTAGRKGFPDMNATVAATTYVLPPGQGATAGATPAGPGQPVSSNSGSTTPAATPATVKGTP